MHCSLLDLSLCCQVCIQENPDAPARENQAVQKPGDSSKGILQSALSRKFSKHNRVKTVPQTDTGSQLEQSKANE